MPQWFVWTIVSQSQLRAIDRIVAKRILDAIARLRSGQGDIRTLTGFPPSVKRLRVGDYRVVYEEIGKGRFKMIRIGLRSDVYKK